MVTGEAWMSKAMGVGQEAGGHGDMLQAAKRDRYWIHLPFAQASMVLAPLLNKRYPYEPNVAANMHGIPTVLSDQNEQSGPRSAYI